MTIGTLTVTAPPTASARLRRGILLAVLIVIAMLVAPRALAGADGVAVESVLTTYTVSSGETLWSIASSLTPTGEDVSEKLAEIQQINRMSSSQLAAGAQILIPLAG